MLTSNLQGGGGGREGVPWQVAKVVKNKDTIYIVQNIQPQHEY